jgi:hypothetical protein
MVLLRNNLGRKVRRRTEDPASCPHLLGQSADTLVRCRAKLDLWVAGTAVEANLAAVEDQEGNQSRDAQHLGEAEHGGFIGLARMRDCYSGLNVPQDSGDGCTDERRDGRTRQGVDKKENLRTRHRSCSSRCSLDGQAMPLARTLALYRRLLRIAVSMPDVHRRRFLAFRARCEQKSLISSVCIYLKRTCGCSSEQIERARTLQGDRLEQKWLDLEVLADNLQVSRSLSLQFRQRLKESAQLQSQHLNELARVPERLIIPVDIRPHSSAHDRPKRRIIDTVNRAAAGQAPNRFMKGPEPSWVRDKRNVKPAS